MEQDSKQQRKVADQGSQKQKVADQASQQQIVAVRSSSIQWTTAYENAFDRVSRAAEEDNKDVSLDELQAMALELVTKGDEVDLNSLDNESFYWARAEKELHQLGYRSIDVEGKGDCLFLCLGLLLFGTQEAAPLIRALVGAWLIDHANFLEACVVGKLLFANASIAEIEEMKRDRLAEMTRNNFPAGLSWVEACRVFAREIYSADTIHFAAAACIFQANVAIRYLFSSAENGIEMWEEKFEARGTKSTAERYRAFLRKCRVSFQICVRKGATKHDRTLEMANSPRHWKIIVLQGDSMPPHMFEVHSDKSQLDWKALAAELMKYPEEAENSRFTNPKEREVVDLEGEEPSQASSRRPKSRGKSQTPQRSKSQRRSSLPSNPRMRLRSQSRPSEEIKVGASATEPGNSTSAGATARNLSKRQKTGEDGDEEVEQNEQKLVAGSSTEEEEEEEEEEEVGEDTADKGGDGGEESPRKKSQKGRGRSKPKERGRSRARSVSRPRPRSRKRSKSPSTGQVPSDPLQIAYYQELRVLMEYSYLNRHELKTVFQGLARYVLTHCD